MGYQLIEGRRRNSNELMHAQEVAARTELERYSVLARNILLANREFFNKVMNALAEKETLLFSDIKTIRESCTMTPFEV